MVISRCADIIIFGIVYNNASQSSHRTFMKSFFAALMHITSCRRQHIHELTELALGFGHGPRPPGPLRGEGEQKKEQKNNRRLTNMIEWD